MAHESEQLPCKRCGVLFYCDKHVIENCQCNAVTVGNDTRRFLENTTWGCLCSNCLAEMDARVTYAQEHTFPKPEDLIEGLHYYLENGFWVFTEQYHILRGHCCKSGCRHCAYGFKKKI